MQDGPPIPWFIADAVYQTVYGSSASQSLETLANRGGFGWREIAFYWTGKGVEGRGHSYATNENRSRARTMIREVWPNA